MSKRGGMSLTAINLASSRNEIALYGSPGGAHTRDQIREGAGRGVFAVQEISGVLYPCTAQGGGV